MLAEGPCTRHQIGGQIRISVHSGILLLAVQGKEKLLEGKRIWNKKTKLMTVWGWLAQTSQHLLVLEQRTLKIRGNPRAMPCSWRLAFPPAMSLEQDLLHQTDFFFLFSCSFYQLWLIFLLLFKSIFTGVLTWTTRLCKLWNEYVPPKDFWVCISRLYSAVNLYLLGEGVNSQGIDPRIYLNSPQKSGLEMEIRERNSHPYSPSDIKYLKSTNSKAEANPLAFKAKGVGGEHPSTDLQYN